MYEGGMALLKRILAGILLLAVLAIAGFSLWAYTPAQPMPQALQALEPGADVAVAISSGWLEFMPLKVKPTTGMILYPGGRVDYRAYAPLARKIAAQGYLVILTNMPFNLAVTQPNKASEVMKAFPQVGRWVIGGHSLGGAMAANFTRNQSQLISGLVLWAAYPAPSDSLIDLSLPVISIYATRDGLATVEKINASKSLLPGSSRFVAIEGGNHAQFGDYGVQAGDLPALIDRESQQEQILLATIEILKRVERAQ
jgi:hypothetical protein